MLAVMLGVVVLATLVYGCGRMSSSPAITQGEREGARQAQTTTPEPTASTHSSRSDSRSTSSKQQAAQSEADCRLVLYVANKNMSPKEAEAFSKLLTEMIGSMGSLSWPEGTLRNAALDHLAVTRYRECKHIQK